MSSKDSRVSTVNFSQPSFCQSQVITLVKQASLYLLSRGLLESTQAAQACQRPMILCFWMMVI